MGEFVQHSISKCGKAGEIRNGSSNTYLIGEKSIKSDYYLNGQDGGNDWNMYLGHQDDNYRSVGYPNTSSPGQYVLWPPRQDQAGVASGGVFGSAHAARINMAFCDGSVRSISYSINGETHRRLGNRKDGLAIDGSAF